MSDHVDMYGTRYTTNDGKPAQGNSTIYVRTSDGGLVQSVFMGYAVKP